MKNQERFNDCSFYLYPPFLEFVGVKEQIKNNSSTDVKMEGNMKKEDLIALGLTEEQAEKVLKIPVYRLFTPGCERS